MTLDEAIHILLEVHTRADNPDNGFNFVVQMGATPHDFGPHPGLSRYAEAWGVLWDYRAEARSKAAPW